VARALEERLAGQDRLQVIEGGSRPGKPDGAAARVRARPRADRRRGADGRRAGDGPAGAMAGDHRPQRLDAHAASAHPRQISSLTSWAATWLCSGLHRFTPGRCAAGRMPCRPSSPGSWTISPRFSQPDCRAAARSTSTAQPPVFGLVQLRRIPVGIGTGPFRTASSASALSAPLTAPTIWRRR